MKAMKDSGYITISGFQQDLGDEAMPGSGYINIADDATPGQQLNEELKKSAFPIWVNQGAGAAMIYHGYKRTGSAAWALGWGVFGFFAPVLAVPISLAQGFAKKRGR
jgi:hypothetical protein